MRLVVRPGLAAQLGAGADFGPLLCSLESRASSGLKPLSSERWAAFLMRCATLFFVFLLLGCHALRSDDAKSASSSDLVGAWRSAPFDTQLGTSTETFCFRADGTVVVDNSTQAGPLHNEGRYQFHGGTLTFAWPTGATARATVKVGSETLSITSERGAVRVYRRIGAKC